MATVLHWREEMQLSRSGKGDSPGGARPDTGPSILPRVASRGVRWFLLVVSLGLIAGFVWFLDRYDDAVRQVVALRTMTEHEYPENPDDQSRFVGAYRHRQLIIESVGGTRFRFDLKPATPQTTGVTLVDVDLALLVAAVPSRITTDPDLTRISLIEREWNRQQVRFRRSSPHLRIAEGGDGFERRAFSRVDLARNCLNAGLWELLLYATEDGKERLYEHLWFTFPLGLYKNLFQQVNALSYWLYWLRLEHWIDPAGTPIRLNRLRVVQQEWPTEPTLHWEDAVAFRGEQARKRKNILTPVAATYADWYRGPVQFAGFIPPGRYSVADPHDTELHYLAEVTGATLRRVTVPDAPSPLVEIELRFRSSRTGEPSRLILGGLDLTAIPRLPPEQYDGGWSVPLGIANPPFFEDYAETVSHPPVDRSFYGFHLDAHDRWLDHHAIGLDGPLLHWDQDDPATLHLYLLSYERHALLNHVTLAIPRAVHPGLSHSTAGLPAIR